MLEGHRVVLRVDVADALRVPADPLADFPLDGRLDADAGVGEPLVQRRVVRPRHLTGHDPLVEVDQLLERPRLQLLNQLHRQPLHRQHHHVVEEPLEAAGLRRPAGPRHRPAVLPAADGDGVVVAPLAAVVVQRQRVERPERQVHRVDVPADALAEEPVGREPAALHPRPDARVRGVLRDAHREDAVHADAGRRLVDVLPLQRRGAVRARQARQRAVEEDGAAAGVAADLALGRLLVLAVEVVLLQPLQHREQVALLDDLVGFEDDRFDVPAELAGERLLADVVDEVRTARGARKNATLRLVHKLPRQLRGPRAAVTPRVVDVLGVDHVQRIGRRRRGGLHQRGSASVGMSRLAANASERSLRRSVSVVRKRSLAFAAKR